MKFTNRSDLEKIIKYIQLGMDRVESIKDDNLKEIMLDYLDLMFTDSLRSVGVREESIAEFYSNCHEFAKSDLN